MYIDLTKEEESYLFEVWHTSKVHSHERYERLIYTVKWFMKEFPIYKEHPKSIYLLIDEETS